MKQRNKGRKIVGVLILILAICISAYAYITTDILKTPEQLFLKYFAKNITQLDECNIEPYEDIFEKIVSENSEIKLKVDYDGVSEGMLFSRESKINTTFDFKSDINNNKQSLDVEVLSNNENFLNLSMLVSEEIVGIKCEGLHDKYLALENNNLKEFFKDKFGATDEDVKSIPDKIGISNVKEFNEAEEKRAEKLRNKYAKKVIELFKAGAFSTEKNIEVDSISGKNIAKKYVFKVNKKEFFTGVTNILTELLEDEEFLSLYKERITTEQLEEIKSFNKDLIAETEKMDSKTEIEIHVYSVDGKTIRTDLVIGIEKYSYQTLDKENESIIQISTVKEKSSDNLVALEGKIIVTNKVISDNKSELNFDYTLTYDSSDKDVLDKKAKDLYGYTNFYEETYKDEKINFKLKTSVLNENNININVESEELKDYNINCNVMFKDNITVNEITEENGIVLTNYTEKQMNSLGQEIVLNLIRSAALKPNSFVGNISGLIMTLFTNQDNINTDNQIDLNNTETLENSSETYSENLNGENNIINDTNNANIDSNETASENETLNQITSDLSEKKNEIIDKAGNVVDSAKNVITDTMNVIKTLTTY